MNFKRSIIRFLLVLIYLILLPGVLAAFFYFLRMFFLFPFRLAVFFIGTISGIFLDKSLLLRFPKIEIFVHEFTHAFTAIIFFHKIHNFVVTSQNGGFVKYGGGQDGILGDDIIGLAPYCLPVFMLFLVLFQPLIPQKFFLIFSLFTGCTFGYHLSLAFRHIKKSWSKCWFPAAGSGELIRSDIACRGFVYSLLSIIVISLIFYGILFAIFFNGFEGIIIWFNQFFEIFESTILIIFNFF